MSDKLNFAALRKRRRKIYLIVMGVVLVIMICLGCQVGSYMSANDVANPFVALFKMWPDIAEAPFVYNYDIPGRFWAGLGYTVAAWFLLFVYMYYDMERKAHDPDALIAGSSEWLTDFKGLQEKLGSPNDDNTLIISQKVALNIDTWKTNKTLNICIFGGSGTGKSRFYVKPNILQANMDMIVTDPAGELVRSTGGYLIKRGYVLKILNLVEMDKSNRYNPFRYIRDENGVLMLVNALIQNTTQPDERGGEKFWKDSEKQMLQALIFYLRYHQPKHKQNFANVLELLRLAEVDENNPGRHSPLDKLFLKPTKHWDSDPVTRDKEMREYYSDRCFEWINDAGEYDEGGVFHRYVDLYGVFMPIEATKNANLDVGLKFYRGFKIGAGKTAKSILISCQVRLQAFNLPAIIKLTSDDDIMLEEFGGFSSDPERLKQALFAIIPAQDKTFNFLVSMLYAQMFETLYYQGMTKCNEDRLPRPVNFLLDEFANIGEIPDFKEKLATIRKYGISCSIILQSLSSLKAKYKDDWEGIIDNCSTTVFLGGQGKETTTYISDMLGDQTVRAKDRSHSEGKQSSYSESYKNQGRKLMTPSELREKPYKKMVIIMSEEKPIYDDKYNYTGHKYYGMTGDKDSKQRYVIEKHADDTEHFDNEMATCDYAQTQKANPIPTYEKVTSEQLVKEYGKWKDYPELRSLFFVTTSEEADVEIKMKSRDEDETEEKKHRTIGDLTRRQAVVNSYLPQQESDDDDDEDDE